jgi:hypothetical protein
MGVDPLSVATEGFMLSNPAKTAGLLTIPVTVASLGYIIPILEPLPPIPIAPSRTRRVGKSTAVGTRPREKKKDPREKWDIAFKVVLRAVNDDEEAQGSGVISAVTYSVSKLPPDLKVVIDKFGAHEPGYEITLREAAVAVVNPGLTTGTVRVISVGEFHISSSNIEARRKLDIFREGPRPEKSKKKKKRSE